MANKLVKSGDPIVSPVDYGYISNYVLLANKSSSLRSIIVDLWIADNDDVFELSTSGEIPRHPIGRLLGVIYDISWSDIVADLGIPMNRIKFDRKFYRNNFEEHVRTDWIRGRTPDKPEFADRLVLAPALDVHDSGAVNMDFVVKEMYEFVRE